MRHVATDIVKSIDTAKDSITRVGLCSEWKWKGGGSQPFFWRWGQEEFMKEARDGPEIIVKGKLPRCKKKQIVTWDPDTLLKVKEKISKVRKMATFIRRFSKPHTLMYQKKVVPPASLKNTTPRVMGVYYHNVYENRRK